MIKHESLFDTQKVCELFSKKDGVPITYVCTSALGDEVQAMDIFFRETAHPEFGNRYFGIYYHPMSVNLVVTNADRIESVEFGLIEDDAGDLQYSAHRHDYKLFENGNRLIKCLKRIMNQQQRVYQWVIKNLQLWITGHMIWKHYS